MSPLETEVKFLTPDLDAVKHRLRQAGARAIHPRTLEVNLRFDDDRSTLSGEGAILRLRQDQRVWLTLKRRPAQAARSEARQLEEWEIEVGDFDAARAILEGLGFRVVIQYEKFRETFALGPVEVVLDELPYGNFVELEGPDDDALRDAARAIGLRWERRYSGSYVALLERVRRSRRLAIRDLTFANFEGSNISPHDLGLDPALAEGGPA